MYVVSTSRAPAAAFGAAVGDFCGTGSLHVALNRGTLLSLYACRPGSTGVDHVQDLHLHCTVKYVCAVPIADPASPQRPARHLLFMCTAKQEVVLLALEKLSEPRDGAAPLQVTTLFQSEPSDCLYQYSPGEVELCCCSAPAGSSGAPSTTAPPLVAFALTRGELIIFDAFAALARDAVKRRQGSQLARLFSPELVAGVARRAKADIFSHCYMDCTEYDVRDIAFGGATPWLRGQAQRIEPAGHRGDSVAGAPPLYLLYADPYGKVHVSEYELAVPFAADAEATNEGRSTTGSSLRLPTRPPVSAAEVSAPDRRVRRCGLLQSNVDPTASRILASRHGLFVVGNHLVTLIQQVRPRKCVFSREIPSRQATPDVSCVAVSTDAAELVIGFVDGVLARVAVLASTVSGGDPELEFRFLSRRVPTVPTEAVALQHDLYLLCSRFDSTLTVRLDEAVCEQVLSHCGPVLDITTNQSGPRCCVVAATGLQRGGGVSVLRSAVMLREQASFALRGHPQRVLCAGWLLCVSTAAASNRFFRLSTRTLTLEELPARAMPALVAQHALVEMGPDAALDQLVLVTVRGVAWLRQLGARCEVVAQLPRPADAPDILFAAVRHGLAALCDGAVVSVHRGQDLVHSVPSPSGVAVAALALPTSTLLAVGHWDGAVVLHALGRGHTEVVGRLLLDSVPRSIACVGPQPGLLSSAEAGEAASPLLYIGTLDGFLVETSVALLRRGEVRRSVFVAPHPLELQELGGPHAGLLCLGDVPLIALCGAGGGVQLTGLHLMGVSAAATVDAEQQCYAFYSRQDGHLHIGALERLEKTSRTFLSLGETVTRLHETPAWGGYAVSLRKTDSDEVLFLPSAVVQSPWAVDVAAWRADAVPLLENERCVFLQTVHLDGSSSAAGEDAAGERHDAPASGAGSTGEGEGAPLLLVGSSFTFPDEQRARSGRITWFALRETRQRRRLHPVASKDIGGALQCCAAVPHYKGRIALGVNGCVCLYKWNTEDQTFVAEERCRLGLTVTKLIPLQHTSLAASVLVALDVRYSAFFVEVDTLQGSVRVLCRDANLRGITDGHIGSDAENLCLFDDDLNFAALGIVPLAAGAAEGDGAAPAAAAAPSQHRFEVRAQCHLGQLVTCAGPGSFAATSLMGSTPPRLRPQQRLLLPGITGPQLVFATAHGGFGVLTPVRRSTYLLLRSTEAALERTTQPVAGLSHAAFREVLRAGQERGVSYVASSTGSSFARDRLRRDAAFNVVDGDMVERFVQLPTHTKRHVCRLASELFLHAAAQCLDDQGRFAERPSSEEQCLLCPRGEVVRPVAQYAADTVAHANAFLQANGLPTVPFAVDALEQQVVNLQRVH